MTATDQSEQKLFFTNILSTRFGIPAEAIEVKPQTREFEGCSMVGTGNNLVFMIDLAEPVKDELQSKDDDPKPFTYAIPAGVTRLVARIPRPERGLEDSVRIRNQVASQALARKALADGNALLVPRVYDWDDAAPGYMIEEFKSGEVISNDEWKALKEDEDAMKHVAKQVACFTKALQAYELPSGITGYGSITFDDAGNISASKRVFQYEGPFSTYREYLKRVIEWQLAHSEHVKALKGWRGIPQAPDLRDRIDKFIANGLDDLVKKIPEHRPTLVHGDLTPPNLLFDKATKDLVAVIDFDFAHLGSPLTEFLYSFPQFQGILGGVAEPAGGLRELTLNGFQGTIQPKHKTGKIWEDALAAERAERPSTIESADIVSDLWWFGQELLYFHWLIPTLVEKMEKEENPHPPEESVKALQSYLDHWGY